VLTKALAISILPTDKRCSDDTKQQHTRVGKLCDLEMLVLIATRHPCPDHARCIIASAIALSACFYDCHVAITFFVRALRSRTAQAALHQAATRNCVYAEIIAVTTTMTHSEAFLRNLISIFIFPGSSSGWQLRVRAAAW
jgi:hypothetical protein